MMQKSTLIVMVILLFSQSAFARSLNASDVDPSNFFENISIIVAAVVSFLTFIYGSKRVLKFLGG